MIEATDASPISIINIGLASSSGSPALFYYNCLNQEALYGPNELAQCRLLAIQDGRYRNFVKISDLPGSRLNNLIQVQFVMNAGGLVLLTPRARPTKQADVYEIRK